MRVIGHMVTKNEARRFLTSALRSLTAVCDKVAVFDDQSTDGTVAEARALGASVAVRAAGEPSFLEHEGRFRSIAWEWMESVLRPEEGDIVVVIDADQILYSPTGDIRDAVIGQTVRHGAALRLPIDEIWSVQRGIHRRIDGWWGGIAEAKVVPWHRGHGAFHDKVLASGSVPAAYGAGVTVDTPRLAHLGYVRAEDRRAKHDRYVNRPGHNPRHIASILQSPTLEPITGLDLCI